MVFAVILALIVCLVLIPTCAFADDDQGLSGDNLAYTAENPDNAGGDNSSGDSEDGDDNVGGSGSDDANQNGNVSEGGNDGNVGGSDAGTPGSTEGSTEGGSENGNDSNKGEDEKQPEPSDEEENESEENEGSEQLNAVKSAPAPVQQTPWLWTSDSGNGYNSLQEAIDGEGNDVNLKLNGDCSGAGLAVKDGVTLTIDFGGHTYTVVDPNVGSAGTETNGFQLLKGSKVTFMNGTINTKSSLTYILIQNYSDLTLTDMYVDGTCSNVKYVVSNNCGSLTVNGNTSIVADDGYYAFDACVTDHYPDGVTVIIDTTGKIIGKVEYSRWDALPPENNTDLIIKSGTIEGTFVINPSLTEDAKEKLTVSGGVFTDDNVTDYVNKDDVAVIKANGKTAIASNENAASIKDILNEAVKSGDALVIDNLPENVTVGNIPAGITVINNSDNTITINGVEVKPGETIVTVAQSKTASTTASAPLYAKYLVLEGKGQQWTDGGLEFVLNSNAVVKVLIDGVEVEFTVAEDGTVTIASAVIEALEAGTHEIQFIFADGSCMTTFTK